MGTVIYTVTWVALIVLLYKLITFNKKVKRWLFRGWYAYKRRQEEPTKEFKWEMLVFFEGVKDFNDKTYLVEPVVLIDIKQFYITDVKVKFTKHAVKATVTAVHPGTFIGREGRLINQLTNYLAEYYGKPVEIEVKESKLWR